MRVMHINASDIGSTGSIVMHICNESAKRGWNSDFVFPRKHREDYKNVTPHAVTMRFEQGIYRRIYFLMGFHYGFAPLSTTKILRLINVQKPDVVHLHCINCAVVNIYRLLKILKKQQIPTVITHHAEFFYTGNCPHAYECDRWLNGCGKCPRRYIATDSKLFDVTSIAWKWMKRSFSGFNNIYGVAVSPWLLNRAVRSPIMEGIPHTTILNGVDTNAFFPQPEEARKLRHELHISRDRKIVLHVTAHFDDTDELSKGGKYLVELARMMRNEPVEFLVVGTNAIHGTLPDNVRIIGRVASPQELSIFYSLADVCVITSHRETFGMVVAESLCSGTPVVGFTAGGPESIALSDYTSFVQFGDVDALQKELMIKWLCYKTSSNQYEIAKAADNVYNDNRMAVAYCDLYERMYCSKEQN